MTWTFRTEVASALKVAAVLGVSTLGLLFLIKAATISRLFLIAFATAATVGFIASRMLVRAGLRRLRRSRSRMRHVLVVGAGASAEQLVAHLTRSPDAGIDIVGYVDDARSGLGEHLWLGGIEDVARLLVERVIDEVAICLPLEQRDLIDVLAALAEEQGKAVTIPITIHERLLVRGRIERLDSLPVLTVASGPEHRPSHALKRLVDIIGATAALVLLGLPMLLIGLLLLALQGRPVLFCQERVGLHGRPFRLCKFRTMVTDAEERLAQLADRNERTGPVFKMTADPRVTPLGRWLRRTSLDELPQLVSVLKGEMSLIGPRPALPSEVALYERRHRRRLSMKPGITGLWQVSARSEADFELWVELDLAYIDGWTLRRDLRILAETVPAVLGLTGR